ncbi:translation termination factor eRF1 [Kickxella alabastrina]|uniref:Translation termination factor eRF1 n=1 Tax=Kickxella alabastrina TaxID=61397 RepID=A0ACC1I8Q4_9FUNG|nr:translation termination factor eRF1 [Kickxella alabastrina]
MTQPNPGVTAKVVKTIDVSYSGENGFNQAISLLQECLSNVKFIQEKKLIEMLFGEIYQNTGKIVNGMDDTFKALDMGTVNMLIVWKNLEGTQYIFHDANSFNVKCVLTSKQESDHSNFLNSETSIQLELVNKEPPIEWIAKVYKHKGTLLEFTDKSPKGSQYVNGFGGIGDMLHWQLDVTQLGSEDNGKEDGKENGGEDVEEDVEDDSDMYYKKDKEQANDEFDDCF